ncbi:TolB family protein [Chengkuizengella axinellae]|uniref:Uncharacterized protein n=1 Tax=Chengkuizengella axinellae TaxID=3064388 RepID=A0ABT9J1V1_9BACL|nr:hypothetical protein [Chengkuizengella sp. 2205SS18-9]MDP5274995.1 hypothetical protein [Chengkuizengella sp. 2205SS18-9]
MKKLFMILTTLITLITLLVSCSSESTNSYSNDSKETVTPTEGIEENTSEAEETDVDANTTSTDESKSSYENEKEDMISPKSFERGVISSGSNEWAFTFNPDATKMYIQRGAAGRSTLYESIFSDGIWSSAELFTFPNPDEIDFERYVDPFISPDGQKFFFVSEGETMGATDLWVSEMIDGKWGIPYTIEIVNSPRAEWLPSVSTNGNLYFGSNRRGSQGIDIYVSKFENGEYKEPELMGAEINTPNYEESPFIAPDESYLIFTRNASEAGFYISYNTNGSWSEAEQIKFKEGNQGLESGSRYRFSPYITPDKQYFYYSNGGDIKYIEVDALNINININ